MCGQSESGGRGNMEIASRWPFCDAKCKQVKPVFEVIMRSSLPPSSYSSFDTCLRHAPGDSEKHMIQARGQPDRHAGPMVSH